MSRAGWKCPECKRIYAPFVPHCDCAKTVDADGVVDRFKKQMPDSSRIGEQGPWRPPHWRPQDYWPRPTGTLCTGPAFETSGHVKIKINNISELSQPN